MTRQFTDSPAVRSKVPLLVGLISPSGAGKTYSALRLATGIVEVCGGEIYGIDTEARRMLHYAFDPKTGKGFKFRHVPFDPPYNPLSYWDAIRYCLDKQAGAIIIDSTSHEHEGQGGVLEMHDQDVDRFSKGSTDYAVRQRYAAMGWIRPKGERRTMVGNIVGSAANFIFCFRAQEKLDWKHKNSEGQPTDQGWQPIGAMPLVYEMTARALLQPGSKGVPDWNPQIAAEKKLVKMPEQFVQLFEKHKGKPISEEIGAEMARWASGKDAPAPSASKEFTDLAAEIAACSNMHELEGLLPKLTSARQKQSVTAVELGSLRDAYAARKAALVKP